MTSSGTEWEVLDAAKLLGVWFPADNFGGDFSFLLLRILAAISCCFRTASIPAWACLVAVGAVTRLSGTYLKMCDQTSHAASRVISRELDTDSSIWWMKKRRRSANSIHDDFWTIFTSASARSNVTCKIRARDAASISAYRGVEEGFLRDACSRKNCATYDWRFRPSDSGLYRISGPSLVSTRSAGNIWERWKKLVVVF